MKHRMDCVMTERHPLVNPRVWQPWYIGDERTKASVMSLSPVALTSNSPPPDIKESSSSSSFLLSASARRHKLKRHRERRDLDVEYAAVCQERAKRQNVTSEELNSIGGSITDSREEEEEEEEENNEDDSPIGNDDDDATSEMDVAPTAESDLPRPRGDRRRLLHHQGRLLLLRADHQPPLVQTPPDDIDDAPLDMTTTKRRMVSPDATPSPSPSPPTSHGHLPPPSFPVPPPTSLLFGHHYAGPGSASVGPPPPPPPPYYQLPPSHLYHHQQRVPRSQHQRLGLSMSPPSGSPPPYVPPPPFAAAAAVNGQGVPPQLSRPSVITCAPAAPKPTSSAAPQPAHRTGSRANTSSLPPGLGGGRGGAATVAPCTNGVTKLSLGGGSSSVNCNGVATGRRSLSDPTPVPFTSVTAAPAASVSGSHHGGKGRRGSDAKHGHRREVLSVGMCDPVIDEHFRRSLGKDYPEYMSAAEKPSKSTSSTPTSISITGMSVDDHFAKALGDTWLRLQGKIASSPAAANGGAAAAPTVSAVATSPVATSSGSCSPTNSNSNSNGSRLASPVTKVLSPASDQSTSRSMSPPSKSPALASPAPGSVVPT